MVEGSAVQSQPQAQNQHHSIEDEAVKRNTDCVYFLASPLTCKKGDECEYRHSDVARLNPRDCWFWLHSNCLNPKCAFRHPPLDGLLGNQATSSAGLSSAPKPHPVAAGASAAKQGGVPCVFFQKGHCLKGNWCPFLHVPNSSSSSSKVLPVKGAASSVEPQIVEPVSSDLQKSVPDKRALAAPAPQPVRSIIPQERAAAVNPESASFSNEFAAKSRTQVSTRSSHQPVAIANGNLLGAVNPPYEPETLNCKSLEEVSREPSPGFDVLVDDERRDSDYYPGEDGPTNEYDIIGHSTDYDVIAAIGNERYQESLGGYDVHDRQYDWEQRISGGGSYYEKRPYGRPESLGPIDESDLRNRLMTKHNKKPNGLRSVIRHDVEVGDEGYEGGGGGNPVSSRLRGRIRLPGRSTTPPSSDRDHGGMTTMMMMRERMMTTVMPSEAFANGYSINLDFEGPKSLAELKNKKEGRESSSFGKRRREEEHDRWFEGPKSLDEILKRKRGGGVDVIDGNGGGGGKKDGEDELFEYAGGEDVEEEGGGGEGEGEGEEEEEEYDDEEFAKKMGVVVEE